MSLGNSNTNHQVWHRVLLGDVTAYQAVVESHQSAVSAVAYAIVGDFPISQDIAQETFWVAWTKRDSLRDVRKLGSWLCGIARNLAKQWRRRHKKKAIASELTYDPASPAADPLAQSIAEEEQRLVWSALEEIPENYREVLTLYYRQGQSINQVAETLDLKLDTARQRLSRGRTMLRGRVANLIEGVLDKSRPDKSFTGKVIAGLAGSAALGKTGTAAASTVSASKIVGTAGGVLGTGVSIGVLGGVFGAVGGLVGGFLGIWIPAQLAPTETERQLILQQSKVIFGIVIIFLLSVGALTASFLFFRFNALYYVVALLAFVLAYLIPLVIHSIRMTRLVNRLRESISVEDDPNQSSLAKMAKQYGGNEYRIGRVYESDLRLFGMPLISIKFNDIDQNGKRVGDDLSPAKGWVAFGDQAVGVLFAVGGVARGLIAIGGVAIGGIAVGGISLGVVSIGGLAIAAFLAIGGGAIGYDAVGGGALAWHSAAGGLAIAWEMAEGGLAIANDFAKGGLAMANEANTLTAEIVIERESNQFILNWLVGNQLSFTIVTIVLSMLPVFLTKFIYQKVDSDNPPKNAKHLDH